jgi:hypothetical protein
MTVIIADTVASGALTASSRRRSRLLCCRLSDRSSPASRAAGRGGVVAVTNAMLLPLRRAGSPRIVIVSSEVGSIT